MNHGPWRTLQLCRVPENQQVFSSNDLHQRGCSVGTANQMSPYRKLIARYRWPIATCALLVFLGIAILFALPAGKTGDWVVPGEFEQQQALLLAWEELPRHQADLDYLLPQREVLADIIAASYKSIAVVVLVSDDESRLSAEQALKERNVPLRKITFVDVPFDSIWIRDYGPISVKSADGQVQWRHHEYKMTSEDWTNAEGQEFGRDQDADLARRLARLTGITSQQVPLVLYGGGISSNGDGLLLVASDIVKWNKDRYGYSKEQITDILMEYYGATEVIFMTVLKGEPTGHLDMFATFVSPDTVVIGSYPESHDPINAMILNANAQRLSGVQTSHGPLKVARITMAPHDSRFFGGTYANVVFANGTLLVPTYGIDPSIESSALDTYKRLLPEWNIVGIDCGALIIGEGAAHCVTLNMLSWPAGLKLPAVPVDWRSRNGMLDSHHERDSR
jgi:agmatine deiminase